MAVPIAGQRAAIDPATGQLRPLEHDDVAPVNVAVAGIGPEPQEMPSASGGVTVMVPEDMQMYTVATRTPDGKVAIQHTAGSTATARAIAAPAKASKKPSKETRNDR